MPTDAEIVAAVNAYWNHFRVLGGREPEKQLFKPVKESYGAFKAALSAAEDVRQKEVQEILEASGEALDRCRKRYLGGLL